MAICSVSFPPSRLNTPASHPASFFHHHRVAFSISSALFAARRCPFFPFTLRKPVFLSWNRRWYRIAIALPRMYVCMYGFFFPLPPTPPRFLLRIILVFVDERDFMNIDFVFRFCLYFVNFTDTYSWMNVILFERRKIEVEIVCTANRCRVFFL